MEVLYKKVHAAIRADPTIVKSNKPTPKEHKRYTNSYDVFSCILMCTHPYSGLPLVLCRYNLKKLTYEQRKAKLVERLNQLNSSGGADSDDE
jgi:large subunit ribosomal protein L5e